MTALARRRAVVTGGTDGIGAASARELRRRGADVLVIGRSPAKAEALVAGAAATPGPGSLAAVVADFSSMAEVTATVGRLAADGGPIDLLVHAVGILLPRTEHTAEGIEKDLAVSYLSRFVFLETAASLGLLHPGTRLANIAASSPRVPRYARLDMGDLAEVRRRVGMRSHGQAQLANDLLTAQAGRRYGIAALGYGPGSVRTSIRREVPAVARALLAPVFRWTTREPDEVARQLVDLLTGPEVAPGQVTFAGRRGVFPVAAFIADRTRQEQLLQISLALAAEARDRSRPATS